MYSLKRRLMRSCDACCCSHACLFVAVIPSQIRAGRFRFSYAFAGRAIEEDVYCVLSCLLTNVLGSITG
jgi:hypothetical protein